MYPELAPKFNESGVPGEIAEFIADMPGAFAEADIVVSRAGMGAVSELAAAGKPSILVPLPGASDQHQLKNAQAFEKAGAARLVLDSEMTGARLVAEVTRLTGTTGLLEDMSAAARAFAWASEPLVQASLDRGERRRRPARAWDGDEERA